MHPMRMMILGLLSLSVWPLHARTSVEAPREGAVTQGNWASGVKEIFGTAYETYNVDHQFSEKSSTAPLSKIWFTGSQGLLSEVYWPTIDMPQTRDTEILVTDEKTFLFHERESSLKSISWLQNGIPAFKVTHFDSQNRFELEKTIFADPDHQSVVMRVRFKRNVAGLKLYVLHKPAAWNTPLGDFAEVVNEENQKVLLAWESNFYQALVSSKSFEKASAAFVGPFDGVSDLFENYKMENFFQKASDGNVSLLASVPMNDNVGDESFELVLSFGNSKAQAIQEAKNTLKTSIDKSLKKYVSQWSSYLSTKKNLSEHSEVRKDLFLNSLALIKSMEDKTFSGAFVASPAIPWGLNRQDWADAKKDKRTQQTGGYHLIWPRDLYMMATSFLAVDDFSSAVAALNRLKAAQYGPQSGDWNYGSRSVPRNGSFPQNFWVDGESYWDSLQLDEVAMPVILIHQLSNLGKINLSDYWDMAKRASDFLVVVGPWTAQERWEEHFGLSPSTIAAGLRALRVAAELAVLQNDLERAEKYRKTAEVWDRNLEKWTFTERGEHGNGRYYLRIEAATTWDQVWDPNDDFLMHSPNGAGAKKEKNIIDGGFLELVRLGIRKATNPYIQESLPEYDATIRVEVPGHGPGFRRYLGDRYNTDERTGKGTAGMPWPLLSGERAHFEVQLANEKGGACTEIRDAARPYLIAMERFATPTSMLPEQVWDEGDRAGQPTGAATPLGWAHGEYIKLLRTLSDCKVF